MKTLSVLSLTSLLFSGAIFGFFYAWVCSTMWGLDNAAPEVAIAAMQAMNASVRNVVFAPAFFGTPFVIAITAVLAYRAGFRTSAWLFAAAAAIYFLFGMVLTMSINVPMNEALALVEIPNDTAAAQQIWNAYSAKWQFWNQMRTIASGVSLLLVGGGLMGLRESSLISSLAGG